MLRYWWGVTGAANTRRWPNVGLTLAHRLRRWTNISPTLVQRLVSAGGGGDTRWSASRNEEVLLCSMYLRHRMHNDVRPRRAGWDAAPAPVPGHPGEGQDWGTGPRSRDVPQANTPPRPQRIKMLMHSLCNDYCMQNNPVITSGWSVIKQMGGGGGLRGRHRKTRTNYNTETTKHLYDIYTMLDQRRRLWTDVV